MTNLAPRLVRWGRVGGNSDVYFRAAGKRSEVPPEAARCAGAMRAVVDGGRGLASGAVLRLRLPTFTYIYQCNY